MDSTLRRTWAEIDMDALAHNYETLRKRIGENVKFLGVVKADAYGHGSVQVSRLLQELGADYLAVSSIDEAIELRHNSITMPILILGHTPKEEVGQLIKNNITQAVTCKAKALDNSYYADYIIVGDTDNPGESSDIYQDVYDNNGNYAGLHATLWEQALYDAFGEHFLNTRLYLMENALSDCGLTPTKNDIIDIQTGNLPEQIRADFTHFNSYGYYSKAKAIYLKGIELGYWN